jgi:hypothetical protein
VKKTLYGLGYRTTTAHKLQVERKKPRKISYKEILSTDVLKKSEAPKRTLTELWSRGAQN